MSSYAEKLEKAETFEDVYRLVKQLVMEKYGLRRAGMGLVLAELPNELMAFHEVGSNSIVVNKTLLNAVSAIGKSKKIVNSYIFVVLLHEYLHTFGFDERQTRGLVRGAVLSAFPYEHPAVRLATTSVYEVLPELKNISFTIKTSKPVIVKDFDTEGLNYIG